MAQEQVPISGWALRAAKITDELVITDPTDTTSSENGTSGRTKMEDYANLFAANVPPVNVFVCNSASEVTPRNGSESNPFNSILEAWTYATAQEIQGYQIELNSTESLSGTRYAILPDVYYKGIDPSISDLQIGSSGFQLDVAGWNAFSGSYCKFEDLTLGGGGDDGFSINLSTIEASKTVNLVLDRINVPKIRFQGATGSRVFNCFVNNCGVNGYDSMQFDIAGSGGSFWIQNSNFTDLTANLITSGFSLGMKIRNSDMRNPASFTAAAGAIMSLEFVNVTGSSITLDGAGIEATADPITASRIILVNGAILDIIPTSAALRNTNLIVGKVTRQTLVTPGAGTYTPSANLLYAHFRMVGAGGGSGGALGALGQAAASGAGGAGGYAEFILTAAEIGANKTFSIGAGGVAGTDVPGNGGNGGDTTLATAAAWTVGGGNGSVGCSPSAVAQVSAGAIGGTVTNGTGEIINVFAGQKGGTAWTGASGGFASTGRGGNGPLGAAGPEKVALTGSAIGEITTGYGVGAGGSFELATALGVVGRVGATGAILITEYCSS